jgi:alanyl-tRNA synthetase
LHKGTVVKGSLAKGANVTATIDTARRDAIARAHTATHLLQAALRTVVGTHVQQQGSFVEEDTVRFDFNHFQGLKSDELEKIEDAVNAHILDAYLVVKKETTQDEAKKMGALAFFEEKYGDTVRVVKIDGVSTEFCGGTHLDDTAHAGIFVITSESSVSSGIRRVEALTGIKARALLAAQKKALKSVCDALKVTAEEAVDAVSDLAKKAKQAAKELETAKFDQFVAVKAADIASKAQQLKTVKAAVFAVSESESGMLKRAIDAVRDKMKDKSVIVGFALGEKLALNVSKTKDLKGPDVHCGNIAETIAAAFGAQGGGKDDFGFCGMKADGSKDVKAVEAAIKDALAKAL